MRCQHIFQIFLPFDNSKSFFVFVFVVFLHFLKLFFPLLFQLVCKIQNRACFCLDSFSFFLWWYGSVFFLLLPMVIPSNISARSWSKESLPSVRSLAALLLLLSRWQSEIKTAQHSNAETQTALECLFKKMK